SRDATVAAVAGNARQWQLVLERLEAQEMPPEKALRRPEPDERAAVVAWIRDFRDCEARQNAGDPGTVLARRLSNAEFDYTIRDRLGRHDAELKDFAAEAGLSPKYLALVWSALTEAEADAGPLVVLRAVWRRLPLDEGAARRGCERMRDLAGLLRAQLKPNVP